MRYAGFHEFISLALESMPQVERQRVDLRMKHDSLGATPLRLCYQCLQQHAADASPACLSKHSHAANVAVGQQSRGADSLPLFIEGHRMQAGCIHLVPFHVNRDALLEDEYLMPYALRCRFLSLPVANCDPVRHRFTRLFRK